MSLHPVTSQRADQMVNAVGQIMMAGMVKLPGGKSDSAYVATAACAIALQTLALTLGNPGDDNIASKNMAGAAQKSLNPDSFLFAALLAVRAGENCTVVTNADKSIGIDCELHFGPNVILEAMQDFEKLTGRKPDANLDPEMVKAVQQQTTDDAPDLLGQLLAAKGRSIH